MYENDLKHGQGEFRWSDGRVLKGTHELFKQKFKLNILSNI